jgi:hypothetical protein
VGALGGYGAAAAVVGCKEVGLFVTIVVVWLVGIWENVGVMVDL